LTPRIMSVATNLSTFFEGLARKENVELPEGYGYRAEPELGVGFYVCDKNQVCALEKPLCIPSGKPFNQGYMILYAFCQKEGLVSLLNGGLPPRLLATQKEPSDFDSFEAIADNFGNKDPAKAAENSKYCVALRVPTTIVQQVEVENRDIWMVQFSMDRVMPFLQAAKEGDAEKVTAGLDAGADANAVDEDGVCVLMMAAFIGSLDTCKALVSRDADVNYVEPLNSRTPLMFAAQGGHTAIVSLLLENGADHSKTDSEEQTALAWAATAGKEEVAQVLRAAGSNDPKALEIATAIGHTATVAVLEA